jgi:hypothetical protein
MAKKPTTKKRQAKKKQPALEAGDRFEFRDGGNVEVHTLRDLGGFMEGWCTFNNENGQTSHAMAIESFEHALRTGRAVRLAAESGKELPADAGFAIGDHFDIGGIDKTFTMYKFEFIRGTDYCWFKSIDGKSLAGMPYQVAKIALRKGDIKKLPPK